MRIGLTILGLRQVARWRLNENKPRLQSQPGLLLVSGLGFAFGLRNCQEMLRQYLMSDCYFKL